MLRYWPLPESKDDEIDETTLRPPSAFPLDKARRREDL